MKNMYVSKVDFLTGHKKVGTLMNYDPIPTTSKQAAMAMTVANAGKSSKKRKIDQEVIEEDAPIEDAPIVEPPIVEPPIVEPPIEEIKSDDEYEYELTQGKNSNVTDAHTLFFMREQQLAIERQRMFLLHLKKK